MQKSDYAQQDGRGTAANITYYNPKIVLVIPLQINVFGSFQLN